MKDMKNMKEEFLYFPFFPRRITKSSFVRLVAYVVLFGLPGSLQAAPPPWWSATGTKVWDSNLTPNGKGPANLGQLKNMAKMARLHMNDKLGGSGGAGSEIDALVAGFGTSYTPAQKAEQYKPINLGQLKKVASVFYTRLGVVGHDSRGSLIAHGYAADWPYDTPWNPYTEKAVNYSPATVGQLKMVFSFDLGNLDVDGDGMPDWWENAYLGGNGASPTADGDLDGLSNLQEYQAKTSPGAKDNPVVKLRVNVTLR